MEPIRSCDDLASYFHFQRNQLGLSNETLEQLCGMTKGHADKLLGPSKIKNLSKYTIDALLVALAIQLIPEPDPEREAKMSARYEQRNESQVRKVGRVSKDVLERVRPHLFAELGRAGGIKRAQCLPATQRSEISRRAAHVRWRRFRKMRRELAAVAAQSRSENRESAS
jgi:hypothetical protein